VEAVEPRDPLAPPPPNSELKEVIVERMINAGYVLGAGILERAKEYDARMSASFMEETEAPIVRVAEPTYDETWDPTRIKNPVEEAKLDWDEELRRRYKVNEPRSTVKDIAMAKAMCLDEKFKILEPATMAADYSVQKCKMIDERYKVLEKTVAPTEKAVSMAKAGYHSLKEQ